MSSPSLRPLVLCVAGALVLWAASCRSTSTNVTGPSSSKCALTLSGAGLTVPGAGGTGSISISTERECTWTATAQNDWLTITSGASGQGPGTVAFRAAENPAATPRTGAITVGSQRAEVLQQAAPCTFAVTPSSASVPSAGGPVTFSVQARAGCAWTAQTSAPWTTVTQGASGSGDGAVVLTVAANSGAPRTTTVTIAGQAVAVSQGGASCAYGVSLSASAFGAAGGAGTAAIATAVGCEWTVTSSQPWLAVTGGSSGSGTGSASFSVAPNSGAARTALLIVAGQAFTVSQASGQSACRFAVSPGSQSVSGDGGGVAFDVSTTQDCSWTATSNVSWLTLASGSSGTGSGRVSVTAAPNAGPARSGTLSIAGETVTVNQAATVCTYTVAPATISVPAGGGPASVAVTTGAGCAWTAASNATWLTVTGGGSGAGSGTVSFAIAANSGGAREGALTVAGQTVTVSQAGAACSYSLSPASLSVGAAGGPSSVAVTAPAGCTWTAASNDAWISITGGASGNGAGTVSVAVSANTGAARTGTLTIAGQSFVVSQSAAATTCTYTIAPTSQTVAASGTTLTVQVTTAAGCAWTATSNAAWLTVTAGASGSSGGTVTLTVAANTGTAPRDGTATIAGQTLTVSQAGAACSYTLSPPGAAAPAAGGSGTVDVATATGCDWTASSNAPWLGITGGSSGSGSGRVTYSVAANTDVASRSGSLTIAGQTFTVTQAGAPCSYSVSPPSQTAPATGGALTFAVSAAAGCSWTAVSNAAWITITSGTSGSGTGSVNVSVAANTTGAARAGTLTIAGQTVTINQQ